MNRKQLVPILSVGLVLLALVAGAVRLSLKPDATTPGSAERVVVVGVPGLKWEDVSADLTPNLWALAEQGSVGSLTTRAARSVTCPWDGWVTLGAGNRSLYPDPVPEDGEEAPPADVPAEPGAVPTPGQAGPGEPELPGEVNESQINDQLFARGCVPQQTRSPSLETAEEGGPLATVAEANDELSFGAEPGALGKAVSCTTTIGSAATLAVAAEGATVNRQATVPRSAEDWVTATESCPLTLVSVSALPTPLSATELPTPARAQDLADLDTLIGELVAGRGDDGQTLLMVAGISESGVQQSRLHVAITSGPGMAAGVLTSSSTGRAPYVQLIDVAPTALAALGIDQPSVMAGQPFLRTERTEGLAETVSEFRDLGVAAANHRWLSSLFVTVLLLLSLALCIFGWALLRANPAHGDPERPRRLIWWAGLVVGSLPAGSFLANVVPWWKAGTPSLAVVAATVVGTAAVVLIAVRGPWRTSPLGPVVAVAVTTAAILGVDVLTGSWLELNGLLGYNAIVAGRFTGFGNVPFAIYAAAGLASLAALVHGRSRRAIRWLTIGLGVALIIVNGTPGWGADFGGVIALSTALVVFGMLALGIRPSLPKLALAAGAGVVAVAAIALLDYSRPASDRTHLGRFVGQLMDGTAWTVVARKAGANVSVLFGSPMTLIVPVFVVILFWLFRRPDSPGRALVAAYRPTFSAALVGIGIAGMLGFLVNDSGIAVLAAAGLFTMPLLLAAVAGYRVPGVSEAAVSESAPEGVTVNSRESRA